jgi:putative ABC transport system substrate-binding protein
MRRNAFIAFIGGVAALLPLAGIAQQSGKLPVIGVIGALSPPPAAHTVRLVDAFRAGLGEGGYVEDKNVLIEYRWADGHYDRLPALAAELIGRGVTVIAAMSAPTVLPAKASTTTIPIVFFGGFDPVEQGLVKSLAHPGGNLTGVAPFFAELSPKRLELLHLLVPRAVAFGLLVNPHNPNAVSQSREVQRAARTLGLRTLAVEAGGDDELAPAFDALSRKVDGLIVGADALFVARSDRIVTLAGQHRLPTIYFDRQFVDDGGLISYGDNIVDTWRQVGRYVVKILNGAKPADLPVEQPTKFELIFNAKTARTLGLTVPESMLARADEVIE